MFIDGLIVIGAVIEQYGPIFKINFLNLLTNVEKCWLGEIFKEPHVFEEIVLKINCESYLSFPKLIETLSFDFNNLHIWFGNKPVVGLLIHKVIDFTTPDDTSLLKHSYGLRPVEFN